MSKNVIAAKKEFVKLYRKVYGAEITEETIALRWDFTKWTRMTKEVNKALNIVRNLAERVVFEEKALAEGTHEYRKAVVWDRNFDGDTNNYEREFFVKVGDMSSPIADCNTGLQFVKWME